MLDVKNFKSLLKMTAIKMLVCYFLSKTVHTRKNVCVLKSGQKR